MSPLYASAATSRLLRAAAIQPAEVNENRHEREGECGPGDVIAIPPGHDAEVVGDKPCVFIDFGEFGDYAKRTQRLHATISGGQGAGLRAVTLAYAICPKNLLASARWRASR